MWTDYKDIGDALFVRTQEILVANHFAETKKELPTDDNESTAESKASNNSKASKSVNEKSKASATSGSTAAESKMSKSEASSASKVAEKKKEEETKKPLDVFSDINLGISDGEEEPDNMSKDRRPKHKNKVSLDTSIYRWCLKY